MKTYCQLSGEIDLHLKLIRVYVSRAFRGVDQYTSILSDGNDEYFIGYSTSSELNIPGFTRLTFAITYRELMDEPNIDDEIKAAAALLLGDNVREDSVGIHELNYLIAWGEDPKRVNLVIDDTSYSVVVFEQTGNNKP